MKTLKDNILDKVSSANLLVKKSNRKIFLDNGIIVWTDEVKEQFIIEKCTGVCMPIVFTEDIMPYKLITPKRLIRIDKFNLSKTNKTIMKVFTKYKDVRILLKKHSNRPIACLTNDPFYYTSSVIGVRSVDGIPNEVLVALLNSSALAVFYDKQFKWDGRFERNADRHKNYLSDLKQITIPNMSEQMMLHIVDSVRCADYDYADWLISSSYGLTHNEHEMAVTIVNLKLLLRGEDVRNYKTETDDY